MNRYFDAAHEAADLAVRIVTDIADVSDGEHIAAVALTSSAA
jgi:hypothetical protein